MTQELYPLQWD